jgi:BolA family transcriptional regulator, general stress-responsive regulator
MRAKRIEDKIKTTIPSLDIIKIEDESHMHSGRVGAESHFKLLVVSDFFENQTRVDRQKWLNNLLKEEFASGMHALSMRLLTVKENKDSISQFQTPQCESKKNKNSK